MRQWTARAVIGVLALNSAALANVEADFNTILKFGPRVAGTPGNESARGYLEQQLRTLGYETRRESFTYPRFDDLGSDVRLAGQSVPGRALQGSRGGEVSAPLARVPGVGNPEDFAQVDARGKIAVVQRGVLPFAQKAKNAAAAGAVGLIVVNHEAGELRGTLGESVNLPVLGVTREAGGQLQADQVVTLAVRVREGDVQGVNIVAFKSGVTKPDILFGGHLDSVPGAPGANDNLSGTLAVLDLARRAAGTPLAARSYFVLFDGEEDGLRGSRAFVKDNAQLVQGLKAMFNFDMVGVNASPLEVGGTPELARAARSVVPDLVVVPRDTGGSDHVPFLQAGVPALFFHRGLDVNYHQPTDTVLDLNLVNATVEAGLRAADAVLNPAPAR